MLLGIYRFSLLAATALAVSGCSLTTAPDPELVLSGLTTSLSQLATVHYRLSLDLQGGLTNSITGTFDSAQVTVEGDLRNNPGSSPEYSADTTVFARSGMGDVKISGQIIGLDDYTYFQISDLVFPNLLPVSLGTDRKWYKVRSGVSASGAVLGDSESAVVEELAANTQPFEVVEVLPTATVQGKRAYRYRVRVNPSELVGFLEGVGRAASTTAAIPDLNYLSDYQPEVYISAKDYQLLRLTAAGVYLHDNLPTAFDLSLEFSDHNRELQILAPSASQNLDNSKIFSLPKLPF